MIRVESLSYSYPNSDQIVLREIDLRIPKGQFCGVVGPNEAGKSTLCYALTGFIPHYYKGNLTGQVSIAGKDVANTPLYELAGVIGLVFQNPFNQITGSRFTVREEVAFGLENLGMEREEMFKRVAWALDLMGLKDLADRSPFALSGGQQQRLAIAAMVAMRPRILVLDEPTSQLDPVGTRELFASLHAMSEEGEITVVLVEHKLEWLAGFADRVILLAEGSIVADGPPRTVLASPLMERYGVRQTRYTRAASLAQERGAIGRDRMLPVTLEEAVDTFR
ncbi:MAG: ATP-binding cassette domain-containing protein [Anaerolineales bacterium]|nr:ATP-binding cassette domain-containing protein [Anaerolineales bacterium]